MDLAYDGEPYRGFARQPEKRTVQGDLEVALSRCLNRTVEAFGAGRTDAGVHALGQVVSVPGAPDDVDPERLKASLNSMLGPAMVVSSVQLAPHDWHARFDARSRTYIYAILNRPLPDPFLARTSWHVPARLDLVQMNESAGHLLGERDFSSFGRLSDPAVSAVRTLFELKIWRAGALVLVKARASAFLQQMVRSLVGTLALAGQGRRSPDDVLAMLAARDRSSTGPVAPPEGLCLVAVEYDAGWSRPQPI
ncbi:MAG: tRNA pseudouridine(38-40) synthase TruA [Actinomycetota bacterium]